jgi:hypothetical protein
MDLKMTTKFFLCIIAALAVASIGNTLAGGLTLKQRLYFGASAIIATQIINWGIKDDK